MPTEACIESSVKGHNGSASVPRLNLVCYEPGFVQLTAVDATADDAVQGCI